MARAAVKAKQQAQRKAAPPVKARARGRRRHASGGNPNQSLFFIRMRRQVKWIYALLAVLFAVTFAFLGVGSGQNSGLDQLFNGLFGGGGGTSVSKAQHEVDKNPRSPIAYRHLATAYEQKGQTPAAVGALTSYLTLKPKDANTWAELGGLQLQQAQQFAQAYQDAINAQQLAAPGAAFLPSGTLGTAIGQNRIEQVQAQSASSNTNLLYQEATSKYQQSLQSYQKVADLRPQDPNAWFQVASAAQNSGNYPVAVAALKKYLHLNPNTTQRAQIEKLIKQLSPAPAKKSSKK